MFAKTLFFCPPFDGRSRPGILPKELYFCSALLQQGLQRREPAQPHRATLSSSARATHPGHRNRIAPLSLPEHQQRSRRLWPGTVHSRWEQPVRRGQRKEDPYVQLGNSSPQNEDRATRGPMTKAFEIISQHKSLEAGSCGVGRQGA